MVMSPEFVSLFALSFLCSYCESYYALAAAAAAQQLLSVCKPLVCLPPAGLVWIASVVVGSPMLFVQQLEVSVRIENHRIKNDLLLSIRTKNPFSTGSCKPSQMKENCNLSFVWRKN